MFHRQFVARHLLIGVLVARGPSVLALTSSAESSVGTIETVPPAVGLLSAPAVATSVPIILTYSGTTDGGGIGSVELWFRIEGGAWMASGATSTSAAGTLEFTPPGLPPTHFGEYFLQLVATDVFGNSSAIPNGDVGVGQSSLNFNSPSAIRDWWVLH